jgi:L-ectoine synthase
MIIHGPRGLEAADRVHRSSDGALTSLRSLTKADGLGLLVTMTRTHRAQDQDLTFTGHRETSLLLEGSGRLETCQNGKSFDLLPGVLWSVGQQERHSLTISAGARVLNVFNPALKSPDEECRTAALLVRHVSAVDDTGETVLVGAEDNLGFSLGWRRCRPRQNMTLEPDAGWIGCFAAAGELVVVDNTDQPVATDTVLVIESGERADLRANTNADLIVFAPVPEGSPTS